MARGDVIFYRPANADAIEDLAQGDLDQFAVLAAYSQTIPYAPGAFKPWHHVAVSISDDNSRVIGFDERDYQPGEAPASGQLANTELRETEGAPGAGLMADVLRPPEAIADALAVESEKQKGTRYAAAGLMPFALVTAAWMIPKELPARDRLRTMAFGASAVARRKEPLTESCTTAVAKAVAAARAGSELIFLEPPIPSSTTFAEGFADTDQVKAISALLPRLNEALGDLFETSLLGKRLDDDDITRLRRPPQPAPGPRLASIGDTLVGPPDLVVDRPKLEEAVGNVVRDHCTQLFDVNVGLDLPMAPGPMEPGLAEAPMAAPAPDTTIGTYTGWLSGGMEVFDPGTNFEAEGKLREPLELRSDDYLISPAILWDALIDAGFQRV